MTQPVRLGVLLLDPSAPNRAIVVLPEDPGRRRFRFVFAHGQDLRIVAWLSVGADGSLYFNHRIRDPKWILRGEATADGHGGWMDADLKERELEPGEDPKLSIHASGVVTRLDGRGLTMSARAIGVPTLIRQDDFARPDRFELISASKLKKHDVVVPRADGTPSALLPHRPLAARVWVSPLRAGRADVMAPNDLPDDGTSIVIPYTGLQRCQDITVQIYFFNKDQGTDWPETSLIGIING